MKRSIFAADWDLSEGLGNLGSRIARRLVAAGSSCVHLPFVRHFAHGQTAALSLGEVRLGPLQFLDCGLAAGGVTQILPSVLGFDPPGGSVSSGSTTNGSRQVPPALVDRFHGQPALTPLASPDYYPVVGEGVGWRRQIVRCENRSYAGHRQRFARIDTLYPAMGHQAEEQLREQHTFGAKIFRVFRLPCDLRIQIGSHIVLANQLVLRSGIQFRGSGESGNQAFIRLRLMVGPLIVTRSCFPALTLHGRRCQLEHRPNSPHLRWRRQMAVPNPPV
jgi:hypothetical protein